MRLLILALTLGVILVPEDAAARRPWFRRYRPARESTSRADSVERMKSTPGIDLDGDGIADDPTVPNGNPIVWDLNGDGIRDIPSVADSVPDTSRHRLPTPIGR
jgi:hypothetical protein